MAAFAITRLGTRDWNDDIMPSFEAAVAVLVDSLGDRDNEVRAWSAHALAEFAAQARLGAVFALDSGIRALRAALKDDCGEVRVLAALVLARLAAWHSSEARQSAMLAVPVLQAALEGNDREIRARTIHALAEWVKGADPPALTQFTAILPAIGSAFEDRGDTAVFAALAITRLADRGMQKALELIPGAVNVLCRALQDSDRIVRIRALQAITERSSESSSSIRVLIIAAIPALQAALRDDCGEIRVLAALALQRLASNGSDAAISSLTDSSPALIKGLQDDRWNVRIAASGLLSTMGPMARPGVPEIVDLIDHELWQHQQAILLDLMQAIVADPDWSDDLKTYAPVWLVAQRSEEWLLKAVEADYPLKVLWSQLARKLGRVRAEHLQMAKGEFARLLWQGRRRLIVPSAYSLISSYVWGDASNAAACVRRWYSNRMHTFTRTDRTKGVFLEIAVDPAKLGVPPSPTSRRALDPLIIQEYRDQLLRYIEQDLDPLEQELLRTAAIDGLSYRQAATRFDISLHSVRKTLARVYHDIARHLNVADPRSVVELLLVFFSGDPQAGLRPGPKA